MDEGKKHDRTAAGNDGGEENDTIIPLGSVPSTRPAQELEDARRSDDTPASSTSDGTKRDTSQGHRGPEELGFPSVMPQSNESPDEAKTQRTPAIQSDASEQFEDVRPFRLPRQLFGLTTTLAMLAILSVGFLFIYGQVLSLLTELASAPVPEPIRYLGYFGIASLVGVVVAFIFRLIYLWWRLRRSPGIQLRKFDALRERRSLRALAQHEKTRAREKLTSYLNDFDVDGPKAEKLLRRFGLIDEDIRSLRKAKKRLVDKTLGLSPTDWIRQVDQKFLEPLDRAANRRINRVSAIVAAKTMATPIPFIDSVVAAYSAFGLIGDLCRIYNLRTGTPGTMYIMCHAFANIYFAGQMEESTETAVEAILGESASIGSQVFGKLTAKLAEGSANGILLYRLGKSAAALVRPIHT